MAAVMLSQVNDLSCVDAAHWYLEQGLRPIPWVVGDEGSKRAAISGFTYQAYTVTHGDIDRWSPNWQVGLALGDHGSRVYAIDVDSYVELHEWQNQHGAGVAGLGPSWRQTSGRGDGGEHRLYRAGALWPKHGKFSGEYAHLEVISNGLLAVSPSVHPSGRRYRWTIDATREIREAGPLLTAYLGEREVARATNGSKSYPSGGSGGSNQNSDSGRPDVGALLRDGIQSEQDVTLRDVVWFGVMDGKSFEEIHLLWQAIVFKTPLTKPEPWNATYVPPGQRPPGHEVSDFERHYDSAVAKLRDREPIVVEEWMWTAIQHLRQTSTEVSVSEAGVPSVSPEIGEDPGPPPEVEERIKKEQLRLRVQKEARERERARDLALGQPQWIDVDAIVARGRRPPVRPGVVLVSGDEQGRGLFYEGKWNLVYGDESCGKSMLARAAHREKILAGRHTVHIEFDNNREDDIFWDLVDSGVPVEAAQEFLHICVIPERLPEINLNWDIALVTLDAFNPAIDASGLEANSTGAGVDHVIRTFMQPVTDNGACGIVLDHIGHGDANRPSNSNRKTRALRGAAYRMVRQTQGARGDRWMSQLFAFKDNTGGGWAKDAVAGYAVIDGTVGVDGEYEVRVVSSPPMDLMQEMNEQREDREGLTHEVPRFVEVISGSPGINGRQIREAMGIRPDTVTQLRVIAERQGLIRTEPGPRSSILHFVV